MGAVGLLSGEDEPSPAPAGASRLRRDALWDAARLAGARGGRVQGVPQAAHEVGQLVELGGGERPSSTSVRCSRWRGSAQLMRRSPRSVSTA